MNKIYPHPVLGFESEDYDVDFGYESTFSRPDRDTIRVRHALNAETLVGMMLLAGKAKFFCTVVASKVLFRKSELMDWEPSAETSRIEVVQDLSLPEFMGNPTLMAHAGLVSTDHFIEDWTPESKISEFFKEDIDKPKFEFHQFSLLATGGWYRLFQPAQLFRINPDDSVAEGEVKTELAFSGTDFTIRVSLHPKLAEAFRREGKEGMTRRQVITIGLTQAFQQLREEYARAKAGDEHYAERIVLANDLHIWLRQQGFATWEDEDVFVPSQVATKFRKVLVNEKVL